MCGTTILCSEEHTKGATLFDLEWTLPTEMCDELEAIVKALVSYPALEFPGWRSTQDVINFLRKETPKLDSVAAKPLATFLRAVGVMRASAR